LKKKNKYLYNIYYISKWEVQNTYTHNLCSGALSCVVVVRTGVCDFHRWTRRWAFFTSTGQPPYVVTYQLKNSRTIFCFLRLPVVNVVNPPPSSVLQSFSDFHRVAPLPCMRLVVVHQCQATDGFIYLFE